VVQAHAAVVELLVDKKNETPPEMWAIGPESIYCLFNIAGHLRGGYLSLVLFN
jgi:hypothetical protein